MTLIWGGSPITWGYGEVDADAMVVLELGDHRLDLTSGGWIVKAVDFGSPVVREVETLVAVGDGTDDHTEFVGGRNILISLHLSDVADRQEALDELGTFLDPAARPTLRIATEAWRAPRSITVRHSGDMDLVWEDSFLEFTAGFRSVGSPYFAGDEKIGLAWPAENLPGRTYPRSYPWSYPSTEGYGSAVLDNDGNRPAHWVARIFGPVIGPRLIRSAAGIDATLAFDPEFEVAEGDYVQIDSQARTVLLNGESSRYGDLEFTETEWWRLLPGANTIRLDAESFTTPAQAEITFHDTFL